LPILAFKLDKSMNLKNILFFVFLGILFVSCKKDKSLKEFIVDSWETTYIKIDMPTYQKSDSTFVFEDDFKNNPPRRARSIYHEDGTFSAWYVNQQEEKKDESIGKWNVIMDSLYVEYFYNGKNVKTAYHIKKTAEGFIGKNVYDWDNDGAFDDVLIMKTKRLHAEK